MTKRTKQTGVATLALDIIKLDFQGPECLIEDTVQRYVDCLSRGKRIQPVKVRFDGHAYWLEDGFHRLEAVRREGFKKIDAEISPGTYADMEDEYQECVKKLKKALARKGR